MLNKTERELLFSLFGYTIPKKKSKYLPKPYICWEGKTEPEIGYQSGDGKDYDYAKQCPTTWLWHKDTEKF
jgi:hypothetical protein